LKLFIKISRSNFKISTCKARKYWLFNKEK
jgi:hypothetical protein